MRTVTKLFVTLTLTGGLAVTGVAAADLPALVAASSQRAEAASAHGNCQGIGLAILAYTSDHGTYPEKIEQLAGYFSGDLAPYAIRDGQAVGPGCTTTGAAGRAGIAAAAGG